MPLWGLEVWLGGLKPDRAGCKGRRNVSPALMMHLQGKRAVVSPRRWPKALFFRCLSLEKLNACEFTGSTLRGFAGA